MSDPTETRDTFVPGRPVNEEMERDMRDAVVKLRKWADSIESSLPRTPAQGQPNEAAEFMRDLLETPLTPNGSGELKSDRYRREIQAQGQPGPPLLSAREWYLSQPVRDMRWKNAAHDSTMSLEDQRVALLEAYAQYVSRPAIQPVTLSSHVCGLAGFGASGDICEACETRRFAAAPLGEQPVKCIHCQENIHKNSAGKWIHTESDQRSCEWMANPAPTHGGDARAEFTPRDRYEYNVTSQAQQKVDALLANRAYSQMPDVEPGQCKFCGQQIIDEFAHGLGECVELPPGMLQRAKEENRADLPQVLTEKDGLATEVHGEAIDGISSDLPQAIAREYEIRLHEKDEVWEKTSWDLVRMSDGKVIFNDAMKPEDALLHRDLKPLVAELNRLAPLVAERDALREWRDSVSSAVKTIPEFHSGKWAGDKEGWGFHFELINWLRRQREAAESELKSLRGALVPFVRDSRRVVQDKLDWIVSCIECGERAIVSDPKKAATVLIVHENFCTVPKAEAALASSSGETGR